jgi:hypothetical protein
MSISPSPSHPLLAAAAAVHGVLDEAAATDPLYLPTQDKTTLLVDLTAAIARLTVLRADVLAVADDVALDHGARSAGAWLAGHTGTSGRDRPTSGRGRSGQSGGEITVPPRHWPPWMTSRSWWLTMRAPPSAWETCS